MADIDAVPLIDAGPAGDDEPRRITIEAPAARVGRRNFLAVVGGAAVALGITALGWIPLARTARADPGTEYLDCGRYFDGPGGPICAGYPYSPEHCGEDGWFREGCFIASDGSVNCYEPRTLCRAGEEARDAWRWQADGTVWRCADGEVEYQGAPNPERVICNARLTAEPDSTTTTTTTTTTTPPPTPPNLIPTWRSLPGSVQPLPAPPPVLPPLPAPPPVLPPLPPSPPLVP